jgi:hypothetical protein
MHNLPHTSVYESGGQEFESLRARQFPRYPVRIARHSHGLLPWKSGTRGRIRTGRQTNLGIRNSDPLGAPRNNYKIGSSLNCLETPVHIARELYANDFPLLIRNEEVSGSIPLGSTTRKPRRRRDILHLLGIAAGRISVEVVLQLVLPESPRRGWPLVSKLGSNGRA